MAVKNSTIMQKVWESGTNDFQQRIPDPTQQGMEAMAKALFVPMNERFYNEFVDILVNRIGFTIVRQAKWENPLAAFKGGKLNFGSTIQELIPGWIKAHSYEDDVETLLKVNRPVLEQCFHTVNREDRYDITINQEELKFAFVDDYGLSNLIASVMQVPYNSDNYDEYKSMLQQIAIYEDNFGFFKQHLDNMPTTEAAGKQFLKLVREYTGKLRFPSTLYNANVVDNIPVFAKQDELILLYTPEVAASISVDVLASLFNVSKAELQVRTVMVDEFPIPDAVALLTTRDWFVTHDKVYTTNSFYNPQQLNVNYYLHHWEVISCSPFVPAILFTLGDGTDVSTITQEVTGMSITASAEIANPGDKVQLFPSLVGTFGDGTNVKPASAATYELVFSETEKNTRTYVDRNNVLHIQKNAKPGDVLKVVATSTYRNPSEVESPVSASIEITIAGGAKQKLVSGKYNLLNLNKDVLSTHDFTMSGSSLEIVATDVRAESVSIRPGDCKFEDDTPSNVVTGLIYVVGTDDAKKASDTQPVLIVPFTTTKVYPVPAALKLTDFDANDWNEYSFTAVPDTPVPPGKIEQEQKNKTVRKSTKK